LGLEYLLFVVAQSIFRYVMLSTSSDEMTQ